MDNLAQKRSFRMKSRTHGLAKAIEHSRSGDSRKSLTKKFQGTQEFQEEDKGIRSTASEKLQTSLPKLQVFGRITPAELRMLQSSTDKVGMVMGWLIEALGRAEVQKIFLVSPPSYARIYQEIVNGTDGYNQAFRVALVPFPFIFSSLISWFLIVALILCPVTIYVFSGGQAFVFIPVLTFCAMMGFWGLNEIAHEIEEPYGCGAGNLPLLELHQGFVDALGETLVDPMPEYDPNTEKTDRKDYPVLHLSLPQQSRVEAAAATRIQSVHRGNKARAELRDELSGELINEARLSDVIKNYLNLEHPKPCLPPPSSG